VKDLLCACNELPYELLYDSLRWKFLAISIQRYASDAILYYVYI